MIRFSFVTLFLSVTANCACQDFNKNVLSLTYRSEPPNSYGKSIDNFSFPIGEIHLKLTPMNDPEKPRHSDLVPKLCVTGTIALIAAAAAVHKNNNDLAIGLISAGVVTSSVGLVWYIRDRKK
jgi:hypothetical protein